MPFSSGTYTLPTNSFAQPVASTTINSTDATSLWADFVTAFSTCVLKDGTQTITANLPMAGFKLTGLGSGSATGNSLRYEQLFTAGTVTLLGALSLPSTLGVTGVATFTAQPIVSSLTASRGIASDASKGLVSLAAPAQTFLGSDVLLNNASNYFDIVNTGSIGAAGQTWKITSVALCTDTSAAANVLHRIWDGTTVYAETNTGISGAGAQSPSTLVAIVTLAAAATFRQSAKDLSSTSGKVLTTGNSGTANKASCIIAEQIS